MTSFNLLPWRQRQRDRRRRQFALGLAVAALIAVSAVLYQSRALQQAMHDRAASGNSMRDTIALLDERIVAVAGQRDRLQALRAQAEAIAQLQAMRPVAARTLDELARTLPAGIRYDSLTRSRNTLAIAGTAGSQSQITALLGNFESSPWLHGATLENVSAGGSGTDAALEFSVRLHLAQASSETGDGSEPGKVE